MIEKKIRTKSLEELISQPRLVKYDTYAFDELSYTCLLVDIKMLLEENKKCKEVISKATDYIEQNIQHEYRNGNLNEYYLELNEEKMTKLLNILNEVEDNE